MKTTDLDKFLYSNFGISIEDYKLNADKSYNFIFRFSNEKFLDKVKYFILDETQQEVDSLLEQAMIEAKRMNPSALVSKPSVTVISENPFKIEFNGIGLTAICLFSLLIKKYV